MVTLEEPQSPKTESIGVCVYSIRIECNSKRVTLTTGRKNEKKGGKERKKFVSLSGGGNGALLYCHLRIASNASIDIHCFIRLSAAAVGTDTLPPVPLR